MTEALLQAIHDHPDDDVVRLIRSDWLEENGQCPRAELIRLQIEQARLGSHDPRAAEAGIRASDLLAEHELDWLGEWSELLVDWTFARGFLDEVSVEPEVFLAHGERLFEEHPVRRVRFVTGDGQPCGPDVCEELAAHPAFVHVHSLDASGSRPCAGPAWCRAIAARPHLTQLRELDFSSLWRREDVFHDLAALGQLARAEHVRGLRELRLNYPMAPSPPRDEVAEILAGAAFAASLRTLELMGVQLSRQAVARLANAPALAGLERLNLGWCDHLRPEGVREILSSVHLRGLKHLGIGGVVDLTDLTCSSLVGNLESLHLCSTIHRLDGVIPAADWRDLGRAGNLRRLRELHLLYNLIDERGTRELLTAPGSPRLRSLMIMGMSGDGDALADVVAGAYSLRGLTHLELPACQIGASGVGVLLQAPFAGNLHTFCVAGNVAGDEGVTQFIGSPLEAGRLSDLHLHHCQVSPETYEQLFAWQGLRNVERLDLSGSALDPRAVRALVASPHLRKVTAVSVSGGVIPEEGLQDLATLHGPGLSRLRSLLLHGAVGANEVFLLRERFGPRVRIQN